MLRLSSHQQAQEQQCYLVVSMTMPTLLLRISVICQLLHTILYFLPKKIRSLLSTPWIHGARHRNLVAEPPRVPAVDQSELERVFQMFDRNGDGRITKEELNESLENLGIFLSDADLESMIGKIDADGDGCVDAGEFRALYQGMTEVRGDEEQEEEDMREAFEVFDVNGDGFITVEELRSVLSSLGLKQGRTAEECRMMIGRVDVDGDGRVSFKEFTKMMKGAGFAALN